MPADGDRPRQSRDATADALAEVEDHAIHSEAEKNRETKQAEHESQVGGVGRVGVNSDDYLTRHIGLDAHRGAVLKQVLAAGVAGLSKGLALDVEDRHFDGRRGLYETLEGCCDAQEVAGLQGGTDASGDLVGQGVAEVHLLLTLQVFAGNRTEGDQRQAHQQAQAGGHGSELLAERGVLEPVNQGCGSHGQSRGPV